MSDEDTTSSMQGGVKEFTFITQTPPNLPDLNFTFLSHKLDLKTLYTPQFQPHALFGKRLKVLFALVLLTNILINIDHGTLPAITIILQRDLDIEAWKIGLLGSLVYLGLSVGSLLAPFLFLRVSPKIILLVSLLLNGASLFVFTLPGGFATLAVSRTFVGIFQVFMTIYFPVWVDLYGKPPKQRTLWMTLLQVCVPLGIVIGYGAAGFLALTVGWKYVFYGQAVLLVPPALIFGSIPSCYLKASRSQLRTYILKRAGYEQPHISAHSSPPTRRCLMMKVMCARPVFIFSMLSISSLYFVVTAVQFWTSDYLQYHYKASPSFSYTGFATTCITAPTAGVIVGGVLISRLGGYQHPNTLKICVAMAFVACLCAGPIPFVESKWVFFVMMWLLLFVGGFIMPNLLGVMIASIPSSMRAIGNSFAAIFFNALGFLPAPFLYGAMISLTNSASNLGMLVTMAYSSTGLLWTLLALCARSRRKKKDELLPKLSVNPPSTSSSSNRNESQAERVHTEPVQMHRQQSTAQENELVRSFQIYMYGEEEGDTDSRPRSYTSPHDIGNSMLAKHIIYTPLS